MTNLDRLCYLAVEKADVTFERFEAEMTFLMEVFQHVETRGERIQVVVTSRTWTESIRQYAEKYLVSLADRYSHYMIFRRQTDSSLSLSDSIRIPWPYTRPLHVTCG